MEIRCGSCNKLFRVADEKIAGNGIRFKCSRCGQVITITKDDLEMDLLAREGSPEPAPRSAPQPAAIPSPQPSPQPTQAPSAPQPEAREYQPQEYKAQEYQPPQGEQQEVPPASLSDFDFSEPHAAAATAGRSEEAFGEKDFTFDAEPGQDAAPEIEISPEAAAEAEAALTSPSLSGEEPHDETAGMAQPGYEQEPAPELTADTEPGLTLEPAPVFPPPPRTRAAAETTFGGDADLGDAFTAPDGSELGSDDREAVAPSSIATASRGRISAAHTNEGLRQEEIHPLASGNATGFAAGLGCAVPLVVLMTLGFGIMAKFIPFAAGLPLIHLLAIVGTGIISLSVMIGMLIALVQARAGKKLFFLVNIMLGTIVGAGFGAGESAVLSLMAGSGLNIPLIIANAAGTATVAFVLSVLVVISRRFLVFTKDETFSQPLTGFQKAGLAASLAVALVAVYEIGSIAGKMEQTAGMAYHRTSEIVTAAGLQVANAHGYFEPVTGDLVITGSIRNTTDRPKAGWYLVAEIRDDKETVLTTVNMLSGIQLFTAEEYKILAKRGVNIEGLRQAFTMAGKGIIPSRASVDFELRVIGPPKGSTRFLPSLRTFDPSKLAQSAKSGGGR